jgi:drug/metabolite transporter (DMT)-like permease
MKLHSLIRSPAALLIVACALWGVTTILTKLLLASVLPIAMLVLQLAPSAAALWIAVAVSGTRLSRALPIAPLIALGLLNPGLAYTLNMMGLARASASVAVLLWASEPIMILALAALILREQVGLRLLFVVLIGAIGVASVSGVGGASDPNAASGGVLLLLLSVFCCSLYSVYTRKLSESGDPLLIIAIQQTAGLCWALILLAVHTPYGSFTEILGAPTEVLAKAAVSGILYYAVAYWLYINALRSAPVSVVSGYFNLVPVFGVALAFLFLHETLTLIQWIGAVAIILSALALEPMTRPIASAR